MEASFNITYAGQNGTLPDPVLFDTSDADLLKAAKEAIEGGGVPGIVANGPVDFTDFIVDRFAATADLPNRVIARPKTPFGSMEYGWVGAGGKPVLCGTCAAESEIPTVCEPVARILASFGTHCCDNCCVNFLTGRGAC